jgi:hypothetical protein
MILSSKQGCRGKGAAAPFPCTPITAEPPPLRFGQSRLTIPNPCATITVSASLRSDCCSPSLRNAVRLPSGIDVHLHRNTHPPGAQAHYDCQRVAARVVWPHLRIGKTKTHFNGSAGSALRRRVSAKLETAGVGCGPSESERLLSASRELFYFGGGERTWSGTSVEDYCAIGLNRPTRCMD